MPQPRGCGVLFYRQTEGFPQVLLFRRDNKPNIPFPGMLDILGGSIEEGEDARSAIVREMGEELIDKRTGHSLILEHFEPFKSYTDDDGVHQTIFYAQADFEIHDLELLEGEELVWVDEDNKERFEMAFNFGWVVADFFEFVRASLSE